MNLLHIFVIEIYFSLFFLIYYFVYGSHGIFTCMNIVTWLVVAIYLLFGQITLSYYVRVKNNESKIMNLKTVNN